MLSRIPRNYWAAAIFAVVILFYIYSNVKNKEGKGSIRDRAFLTITQFGIPQSRFSGAESFRTTQTKELIAEIENVIEQNGLPADVFYGLSIDAPDREIDKKMKTAEKKKRREEYNEKNEERQNSNVAVTLHNEFHEFYESGSSELDKLWAASPDPNEGTWDVNAQKLANVKATLTKFEPKRLAIRDKLKQSDTHFYYVFERPGALGTSTKRTWFNRSTSVETAADVRTKINTEASRFISDYALLEEYAVAQALLDGNISAAIEALRYIFRITYLASILDNVGVRADAALVRLRAFDVMQRILLDPKFEKRHLVTLRERLLSERKNWTPEYVAWFGDRASGMMLYHNISTNALDSVLEPEELKWLDQRGKLIMRGKTNVFLRGFTRYHETDKIFYLQSMQKVLDICNEPYVKRQEVLNRIKEELLGKEDSYDEDGVTTEPFVANIMLKDMDYLMRLFSKDQSALDRALAVILRSLGQSNTNSYRDPFTDTPYEVLEENGKFQASATDFPRPFVVPVFTETE